jgi:ELWxxDGT repeat protein
MANRIFFIGFLVAVMFCCAHVAFADNPYLVKNINPAQDNSTGSYPSQFTDVNGTVYFTVASNGYDSELWKTDGTDPGTTLVKVFYPLSSDPASFGLSKLTSYNGALYFILDDGLHGTKLWKSDGTEAGTVLFKDPNPGAVKTFVQNLINVNGKLFFSGNGLWVSDGTQGGTSNIKDVYNPQNFTNVNGKLFFTASFGSFGEELWVSDGTEGGTFMVKDINPESAAGSLPRNLTNVNGVLFFTTYDANKNVFSLWKSNGFETGTTNIKSFQNVLGLTDVNGILFFAADDGTNGYGIWRSDGSTERTELVKDINPVVGSSSYYNYPPAELVDVNGTLFFIANDGTSGYKLWKSDGTENGTYPVPGSSFDNPQNLTNVNGTLFFAAVDYFQHGNELWRSDGTTAGTFMVKDINLGPNESLPSSLTNINGTLYFSANDSTHGQELWVSHGSASDTHMVKDICKSYAGSYPYWLTSVNGYLIFTADDGLGNYGIWRSDGTGAGTMQISETGFSDVSKNINETLYFSNGDLWKTDGTAPGTNLVKGGFSGGVSHLIDVSGTLFIATGYGELWKSNGTGAGTELVKGGFGIFYGFEVINGTLYFTVDNGSQSTYELWKSDGKETVLLNSLPVNLYTFSLYAEMKLTNVNGTLFFFNGYEFWMSDGQLSGASMVKDFTPEVGGPLPGRPTVNNGKLLFLAGDYSPDGWGLWSSDGTAANTVMVKPVMASTNIDPVNVNGRRFFTVSSVVDGVSIYDIWKSDGTEPGTLLVKHFAGNSPYKLTNMNGTLFFVVDDGVHGNELWKSDGTADGTVLVSDLYPGHLGSMPDWLTPVGNKLFFRADNGKSGIELFAYSLAISIKGNADYTTQPSVPLTLACPLPGGCTEMMISNDCTFNSSIWKQYATSIDWTLSGSDGSKKVCVKFRNGTSNESDVYSSLITVDTTPPVTIIDTAPIGLTSSKFPSFTFHSADSTATFECWLDFDPAGFQACTSPVVYSLNQGSHIFRVRATDPAGNVGEQAIHEWTIIADLGGSAFGWGSNFYGQLGIGAADNIAHPLAHEVEGPVGFMQVSAGKTHTVAVRNDGTVWAWGDNKLSQLGRPGSDSPVPVQVPGISDVKAIAAGSTFTLALKNDGTVWIWGQHPSGDNFYLTTTSSPQQVLGIDQVTAIAAGNHHSMALRDGTVWVWGNDYFGELGLGKALFSVTYPTIIPNFSDISAISAGGWHSLAIRRSDGMVFGWGWNGGGAVGDGTNDNRTSPVGVDGTSAATKISAGYDFSVAVDASGQFWAWGSNGTGNLGLGTSGDTYVSPTSGRITGNKIIDVAAGYSNTVFLTDVGTVWTAGTNEYGQIGRGLYDDEFHPTPEKVGYLSGVYNISTGIESKQAFAVRTTWILKTIDTASNGRTSLTVDRNNKVHISHVPATATPNGNSYSSVGYMTNAGGTWQKNSLQLGPVYNNVRDTGISVDSNGKVHICATANPVSNEWGVYYLTYFNGNWTTQLVDNGTTNAYSYDCAIAMKDDATVNISYFAPIEFYGIDDPRNCGALRVASLDTSGGAKTVNTVDDGCQAFPKAWTGFYSSVAMDSSGKAHISYFSGQGNLSVKYATGTVGSHATWTPVIVDQYLGIESSKTSIALSGGQPAISYVSAQFLNGTYNPILKFAKLDLGSWTPETVDNKERITGTFGTSLAYVSGTPYISYFDGVNGDLKVAYKVLAHWVRTAVDTDGTVGKYSSIAADSLGGLHVSYWDSTVSPPRSALKYATNFDVVKPNGLIQINSNSLYTNNPQVILNLSCDDGPGIGCWQVDLSTDGNFNIEKAVSFTSTMPYTLPAGDGVKTIYARFRDAANNWSMLYSSSITLDTTKPASASIDIIANSQVAGSTNSPLVSLALSATDANTITQMSLRNESGTWFTYPYATTFAWALSQGEGPKTVSVKFKDAAGNWSDPVSASITLDTTAPNTKISPAGGNYNDLQTVTLTCNDGLGDGVNCKTYYSLSADGLASPTTLYTAPVPIPKNLILRYYSIDTLGNKQGETTAAYSYSQGTTRLSLDLSHPTIPYNGSITLWGRLENMTANNADPSGETITITITAPDGSTRTVPATIYDPLGLYQLNNISGFTQKGAYALTASFSGSSLLKASNSNPTSLLVGASAGYAILIEGKIGNQEGLASHNKTANRIYSKLKARGFENDNIYYFNYDMGQTGVDATPSLNGIQTVIETWAKSHMNGLPAPLYIIMVDHGSVDKFHIGSEFITPSDLATWLGHLENGIPAVNGNPAIPGLSTEALKEKRFIIIGSCYSGSFIPVISQPPSAGNGGRVIITSAAADEVSYKGPQEPTDNIRSGEYFLEELFTQLERGYTFRESFINATALTRTFTQKGGDSANANAPYFDGAVQHPMLDDNGDGTGSNTLIDGALQDGDATKNARLGAGISYNTNSALNPADITAVTETIFLGISQSSATLWAKVNDDKQVDGAVWLEIRNMSTPLPASSSSEQAELTTVRIPMIHNASTNQWERDLSDSALGASQNPFVTSGKYEIFYFVRDVDTLKLAPMKRSVVYKAQTDSDPAPGPFSLKSPADNATVSNMVAFSWDPVPGGNPVTYTLVISTTPNFSQILYKQEEISNTVIALGPDKLPLVDLNNYYWKVQAVDSYGASKWSTEQDWHFHAVINQNGLPGIIQGYVKDSFGTPIGSALVAAGGISFTTSGNGAFALAVAGGTTLSLTATTSSGYIYPGSSVSVASGGTLNTLITMTDNQNPVVTEFTVPVDHSGTTIPITTLTATDNSGAVTLFCIKENNTTTGCSWGPKPASVTVSPTTLSLYAWAKDASGNISAPLEAPLNKTVDITISGSGNGKVYSAPVTIDCSYKNSITTGSCSSLFNYNTPVSLLASPDWNATFGGWGGDTCLGTGNCLFNPLATSKSVTATFIAKELVQVGSSTYSSLQDAYKYAPTGSTIKAKVLTFKEDLDFNLDKIITLDGGKADNYTDQAGTTTIEGSMIIKQGTVNIKGPVAVKML